MTAYRHSCGQVHQCTSPEPTLVEAVLGRHVTAPLMVGTTWAEGMAGRSACCHQGANVYPYSCPAHGAQVPEDLL